MNADQEININGMRYIASVVNDEIVSLKRFQQKYGIWIELKFSDNQNTKDDLLKQLTDEYIQKTKN
ncbi:hypothetical protein [Schinkia azotoformans]|uniref:hypothetical protein n=1 Tax=Schinkia azotoformans TaxID=1454 RepID=UPI002DB98A8C|nr:hypothetical protein [Schinkia azotoformans]MEC1718734.1 hypothetical protein [Schinkia azotoformans]MEC1742761.1 hypothetical protein [Schinkia azotoformans]MEC1748117.1 hypothetical protein [Schinkia azotoformans]MEC1760548.1 hypothetical protein [Schinkia azotoformans]MEC1769293.1 hypothetical protein [Schinkia azotoformans]